MTDISAKDVMKLRERLGVSMMACKKALTEANGDQELAIDILRKSGIAKASAKADRIASEGAVVIVGNAIVKINCETDFVSKNTDFLEVLHKIAQIADRQGAEAAEKHFNDIQPELVAKIGENLQFGGAVKVEKGSVVGGYVHFNNKVAVLVALDGGDENIARDIAMHAVAMNPEVLSPDDVDQVKLAKEKEIWEDELKQSGKPEQILSNILAGKEKKFREQNALLTQPFVKDDQITVEQFAKNNGAQIVEFVRLAV